MPVAEVESEIKADVLAGTRYESSEKREEVKNRSHMDTNETPPRK